MSAHRQPSAGRQPSAAHSEHDHLHQQPIRRDAWSNLCASSRPEATMVRLTTQEPSGPKTSATSKRSSFAAASTIRSVADVHFNPKVADVAAGIVEKVRINLATMSTQLRNVQASGIHRRGICRRTLTPGRARFKQLAICREHGTAPPIGVNHGSLSDRIMSRYGDSPEGIVESCMEFLRVWRQGKLPRRRHLHQGVKHGW